MVEFLSRILGRRQGVTGSPIYRLAVDVATGRITWEQALRHARSYRMASELADGDLIDLDRQAAFEAQRNPDFGLLLQRLTVAAARAKGFEKVYVDLSLNLVEMLERAGLIEERDYYLGEALSAAQRISYQTGYRRVLNKMARYASLEHNDAEARRYLAEQLAVGREEADTREDVDTAILLADMALQDGDRTTAHDLFHRAARSGRRLGYDSAVVNALLSQAKLAIEANDVDGAARMLQQAEDAVGRTVDSRLQGRVALQIGELELRRGQFSRAAEHFRVALNQARTDEDLEIESTSLHGLARALEELEELEESAQCYASLAELERRLGHRLEAGRALVSLGRLRLEARKYADALRALSDAREIAQRTRDPELVMDVHGLLGATLTAEGNVQGALEAYDVAVSEARQAGDVDSEIRWLLGAAEAMLRFQGPSHARSVVDRARRLARQTEDLVLQSQVEALLGQIALVDERHTEAQHAFASAERLAREAGALTMSLHYLPVLARLAADQDDEESMQQYLDEIVETAKQVDDPRRRCAAHGQVASILHRAGKLDEAIEQYQQAAELAHAIGDLRLRSRALQGLATAHDSAGRPQEALENYRRALDASQQLQDPRSTARLHFNVGALLVDLGRDEEARAHLNRARDNAESVQDLVVADRARDLLSALAPPGAYGYDVEDDLPLDESPAPPRRREHLD